jgi:hypothetical protein
MKRLAVVLALLLVAVACPLRAAAFSGFGESRASSAYGKGMTFSVELPSGPPERLELELQLGPDADGTLVAPAELQGGTGSLTWDTSDAYLTPNTPVTYRWRATSGGEVTESAAHTFRYADNRPGLDWHTARMGQATVHWYGGAEAQARRFGDLTGGAVSRAEQLLGHSLDGPVDIFVYDTHDDFFGALGPGAREWTGAATFPNIRTVFMWLRGGPGDYLDRALAHEVTHIVFYDATRNPYHDPARWLNEGFAVWSERQNADEQTGTVRSEARSGLFSFDAISGQFPVGSRGSSLSYAEGATMVERILKTYGPGAMARIAAAYRGGATDAEALKAGTGVTADQLYADYFRTFGASEPKPVAAATIGPSEVRTGANRSAGAPSATPGSAPPAGPSWGLWLGLVVALAVVGAGLWLALKRRRRAVRASSVAGSNPSGADEPVPGDDSG